MSKYITSIALLGAFLIAAPATFADYELFAEWRQENGASYAPGSEVVTLIELTKAGGGGMTGTVSWDTPNSAWSVTENFRGDPNAYWIAYDGTDPNEYADFGIALTGRWIPTLLPEDKGLAGGISIRVDGMWFTLGELLTLDVGIDIQKQSNATGQTFLYSDLFTLLIDEEGGIGIRIDLFTPPPGSSFAIIAVKEPTDVPEPATLAIVGLGLAGLGLARRKRK
jgi:hypothetical protein